MSVHVGKNTGGKDRLKVKVDNYPSEASMTNYSFATVKFLVEDMEITLFMNNLDTIYELGRAIMDTVEIERPTFAEEADAHAEDFPDFVGE
jgi:hypothetical protein